MDDLVGASDRFSVNCTTGPFNSLWWKSYVDHSPVKTSFPKKAHLQEPGVDSPYRKRSVERNLCAFEGMKNGDYGESEYVLRAKN
jgi:hypothetical protein